MRMMAMNWTESSRSHASGTRLPKKAARRAPADPAKNDERANASALYRTSLTPITSAAISRSRMAANALPTRVRARFLWARAKSDETTTRKRNCFAWRLNSIPNQEPSALRFKRDVSPFQSFSSIGGHCRPMPGPPETFLKLRNTWSPTNTRAMVTKAR